MYQRTFPVDAAALNHAVNVRVVAEHEGALQEEDDGERVERGDERDREALPAALPAAPDPVANHDAPGGPVRRDDDFRRVGGHLWQAATSKR